MDYIDYREKLGIGFNDDEHAQFAITCIMNRLERLENFFPEEEYFEFCNITGTPFQHNNLEEHYHDFYEIIDDFEYELDEFVFHFIAFINCRKSQIYDNGRDIANREDYISILKEEFHRAHLAYNLYEDKDGVFLFPKGVELFDDELVSKPLTWLSRYPKAEKAWTAALKRYQSKDCDNASEIADLFRKALEELFREFFKSEKSLINLKSNYGQYLKNHGIPPEIVKNLEALLQQYDYFNNNHAKHTSETDYNVLEYIMYQTGMIMRLLITLTDE